MMEDDYKKLRELDRLLEDAGRALPETPQALVQRVLADAEALQPRTRPAPERPGFLEWVRECSGRWAAVGGLVTASTIGFWIGINPPDALESVTVFPQLDTTGLGFGEAAELSGFGWELEDS